MSFADLGLDPRLLRAISKRGFAAPTPVQLHAIPKTLEGKDVVARARTGSGKTLAYLLPALHRILSSDDTKGGWKVVILVPTRELCEQVRQEAQTTAQLCGAEITASALLGDTPQQLRRACATAGTVVASTPGQLAAVLKEGILSGATLSSRLQMLVLDEADLLLSYGYEEDLQMLAPLVPRSCQCLLMSATVSDDVERLTKLVLHNPVALNLLDVTAGGGDDGDNGAAGGGGGLASGSGVSSTIQHFLLPVAPGDRLLAVMAMLKLGLVRKKAIVFVNTVDDGFRLKLFLDSFGIQSALLNAELPFNSRSHILQTFNKGLFDYLIATDDVHGAAGRGGGSAPSTSGSGSRRPDKGGGRGGKGPRKDEEFGVTRGIDFKGVRTIINYDLPSSVQGYVHRVGRTGRGGETGTAITLHTAAQQLEVEELEEALRGDGGRAAAAAAAAAAATAGDDVAADGGPDAAHPSTASGAGAADGDEGSAAAAAVLKPFKRLTKAQLESLRYRGEDVARSLTKSVVREARAKELRLEILNSAKLKGYFEEHAAEQQLLRHDKALHRSATAPHLRHVPAYLKDPALVAAGGRGGRSFTGSAAGRGATLPSRKRRAPGVAPGSVDPLKAVTAGTTANAMGAVTEAAPQALSGLRGFAPAARNGDEELTEIEKRAEEEARKKARKEAKAAKKAGKLLKLQGSGGLGAAPKALPPGVMPKRNVRKGVRRRR